MKFDSVMPELSASQWSTARRHPTHPPEKFIEGAKPFRRQFWEEAMGRFDESLNVSQILTTDHTDKHG